jgi:UrcA family protein
MKSQRFTWVFLLIAQVPVLPAMANPPEASAKVTVQARLLATEPGVAAAERDIRNAARRLCSRLRDTRLIDDEELHRDCYRNAVRQALASLASVSSASVAMTSTSNASAGRPR